jgi:hypothetical protein
MTKLKAMGVVPGIPDLVWVYGGRVIGFEIKTPKGYTSDDQKRIHRIWQANGIDVHVVRSLIEFQRLVISLLKQISNGTT